ncbi:MAG: hypothetical protein ABUL72_06705, partial [Armatimonadota bacterium]
MRLLSAVGKSRSSGGEGEGSFLTLVQGGTQRILTVPNWSVGRERMLVRQMKDLLESQPVDLHYCQADIDHNRTVTAFSGEVSFVLDALDGLCQLVMPSVNLQRHTGVHPR